VNAELGVETVKKLTDRILELKGKIEPMSETITEPIRSYILLQDERMILPFDHKNFDKSWDILPRSSYTHINQTGFDPFLKLYMFIVAENRNSIQGILAVQHIGGRGIMVASVNSTAVIDISFIYCMSHNSQI